MPVVPLLAYTPTQAVWIEDQTTKRAGIRLCIQREDRNHPKVSGNKWWKLKYPLHRVVEGKYTALVTFGGAYSNHLYAVAAAAAAIGVRSIGVVRGEPTFPLNPTLSFARQQGMELHFVDRATYREKGNASQKAIWQAQFGPSCYLLPEGGTCADAVHGCQEWGALLARSGPYADYVCVAVGTGGTIAGLVSALPDRMVIGFSVLKNGEFLHPIVEELTAIRSSRWRIETAYACGGYGKVTRELQDFMVWFEAHHGIPLDPVYTGKVLYGVYELMKQGHFAPGSVVMVLHTGGLQGR